MTYFGKTYEEAVEILKDDNEYYNGWGRKFLHASDVGQLLKSPRGFVNKQTISTVPLVMGGYFHTLILEPEKIGNYKIIDTSTRSTKQYREESDGKICLLQKEVDNIHKMRDSIMNNTYANALITSMSDYEVPAVGEIAGVPFAGKADVVNHLEGCLIDIKTTADISKFRFSAKRYNYDSQAYVYQKLFDMDMIFVVIDKETHDIGVYSCSDNFILGGKQKLGNAIENYKMIDEIDINQYFISEVL